MSTVSDKDDLLAAEYVLGVLPHAERVVFAMRCEHSVELQARVAFWASQLEPLDEEIEEVTPSAAVQKGIEHRLFGEAAPVAGRSWWNAAGLWRGLTLAGFAAAAVMALFVTELLDRPAPGPGPAYVAELTGETGAVRMMALFEPDTGVLRINRTEGDAAQARVFQLWVVSEDQPPVSLGILPQDASGAVEVPQELRGVLESGGALAISDEPAGGSPTGLPTGTVLAAGHMAPL